MDPIRLNQAPVLQDFRRNVGTTVLVLTLGSMIVAGGADWSYRGLSNWVHSQVNRNVTVPFTPWHLEVRMRWAKTVLPTPTTIHDLLHQHPIKAKLYSVALLCSPRWALLGAWLFDKDPGLRLLHEHIAQRQASSMDRMRSVVAVLVPDLLPESVLEAKAAGNVPLMQLLLWAKSLQGSTLFWLGWLLCPGIQTAYYIVFVAASSPVKCVYVTLIGLVRTAVEISALLKCLQALWRGNRAAVTNSLTCCYLLPFIMTLQSLFVLLLFCIFLPGWITHIAMVACCLWGPPVMIALMTTAWQPDRNRHGLLAEPPAAFNADLAGGALAGGHGAVGAAAAMAGGAGIDDDMWLLDEHPDNNRSLWGACKSDCLYWPPPLMVPDHAEEVCAVPHYFVCPITQSLMTEPAVTTTGATYERTAILEWLKTQRRDPLTSRELRPDQISPNLALYRAIEEWLESNKGVLAAAQEAQQLKQQQQQQNQKQQQEKQQQQHQHQQKQKQQEQQEDDTCMQPDNAAGALERRPQQL